jgi:hypothetical protein
MAVQLCHGGTLAAGEMSSDCHDQDATTPGEEPPCPGSDVVPDLGKLPTFAPLPVGHDFVVATSLHRIHRDLADGTVCPRDGPDLDALCRLLI